MTNADLDVLDETFARLHETGPEFDGWLSNHGPMAVESLVRHGRGERVEAWVDWYAARLEEFPQPSGRITDENWREALGDPRRLGDWPVWFVEQLKRRPWTEVLAQWWPLLVDGLAASATHGVIRVGHIVRVLRDDGPSPVRLTELAQALGYWAARWQPIPNAASPVGVLSPDAALALVPRVPDQSGGVNQRLAQLPATEGWRSAQAALAAPADVDDAPRFLRDLVSASVARYATHGHGNPVMLVHASTAPNAILRVLPSLPREQWLPAARLAWTASAAMYAAYGPDAPGRPTRGDDGPPEVVLDRVLANGDEHAIKFADTALDVHEWTRAPSALSAAAHAANLIAA